MRRKREHATYVVLVMLMVVYALSSSFHPPVKTVELGVLPGLQFSLVRFTVKPGEEVNLVLDNTDDMSHNVVIGKPGTREKIVSAAAGLGAQGTAVNYIPSIPEVLWSIGLTEPDHRRSVSFKAPAEEGVFPYVCTYPGHGVIMYGAMYVSRSGKLPELKNDVHIPEVRRKGQSGGRQAQGSHAHALTGPLHPYTPVPPYHYRVYIQGASPAAIAVSLPDSISYCWDAGTCQLRFAWRGGFLDNSDLWKGKGNAEAKVVGTVFYRSQGGFPLVIGGRAGVPVQYKGYRLVQRYPEFHYRVDGTDVYELIRPQEGGRGLLRSFRIPDCPSSVEFITGAADGVSYSSAAGRWEQHRLRLSASEAVAFSISMTIEKEKQP